MRYYRVPAKGAGTDADPIRPDLPPGIAWVGQPGPDGTYLITTPDAISGPGITEVSDADLPTVCAARGLSYREVTEVWSVST